MTDIEFKILAWFRNRGDERFQGIPAAGRGGGVEVVNQATQNAVRNKDMDRCTGGGGDCSV